MGYPKALLRYRGKTFLESVLEASTAAGLDPAVVVLGPDAAKILSAIDLGSVVLARNERPETGQIGSIRAALDLLINRPVDAAVVWPVDQPHVAVATVECLVQYFREHHTAIVLPAYSGRRGHPVLFARAVFAELLAAPSDSGARTVVRADPARVAEVEVTDAAVTEDIDTPAAYEALIRQTTPPSPGRPDVEREQPI